MADPRPLILDAHARLDAADPQDLESLAFFGTRGVVTCAHDGWEGTRAEGLEAHLEALTGEVCARLRGVGLLPWVALGVHPGRLPWLGLEAVFSRLAGRLGRPGVVAVGEVGLWEGTEREEEIFHRQVELAQSLRLPLVVTLPGRRQGPVLRRTVTLLRQWAVAPERVLVVRAEARAVPTLRALGYRVGLGRLPAEAAAALVGREGPDGLLLTGELGDGRSDPLVASRTVDAMDRLGLSRPVIRRVSRENAEAFFGVRLG